MNMHECFTALRMQSSMNSRWVWEDSSGGMAQVSFRSSMKGCTVKRYALS